MTTERLPYLLRGAVFALCVCLSAIISSCSTVNTILSDLNADSFATENGAKGRKIPLPPMADDFGGTDEAASPRLDGAHAPR